MKITNISQLSGKESTLELDVTLDQLERFAKRRETGEYVQTIFPNLTNSEREFLLTGITGVEWEDAFGVAE